MYSRHRCIHLPVTTDATLARGLIKIQNSGGRFCRGVVWKPHCQVTFCHDALDFNTAYRFCCFDHKVDTAFDVLLWQFIRQLWLAKHKVLFGNCSGLVDTQLRILGSRDLANSWRKVMQTDISATTQPNTARALQYKVHSSECFTGTRIIVQV